MYSVSFMFSGELDTKILTKYLNIDLTCSLENINKIFDVLNMYSIAVYFTYCFCKRDIIVFISHYWCCFHIVTNIYIFRILRIFRLELIIFGQPFHIFSVKLRGGLMMI